MHTYPLRGEAFIEPEMQREEAVRIRIWFRQFRLPIFSAQRNLGKRNRRYLKPRPCIGGIGFINHPFLVSLGNGAFAVIFLDGVIHRGGSKGWVVEERGDPIPGIPIFEANFLCFSFVFCKDGGRLKLKWGKI